MKITTEPRSDQWNADDFIGGPRTFTIAGVRAGSAEQKYDIQLVEGEGRVWRPPLTVLRELVAGWGDDATTWPGHRVTLYRDATVKFGRDSVGGIRVSHMSHIDKPLEVALTVTRGKRAKFTVQPLPDAAPPPDYAAQVAAAASKDDLNAVWRAAGESGALTDALKAAIIDRVSEFEAAAADPGDIEPAYEPADGGDQA